MTSFFRRKTDDPAKAIEAEIEAAGANVERLSVRAQSIEAELADARAAEQRALVEDAGDADAATAKVVALEAGLRGVTVALKQVEDQRDGAKQRLAAEHEAVERVEVADRLENIAADLEAAVAAHSDIGAKLVKLLGNIRLLPADNLASAVQNSSVVAVNTSADITRHLHHLARGLRDGSQPLRPPQTPPPAPQELGRPSHVQYQRGFSNA